MADSPAQATQRKIILAELASVRTSLIRGARIEVIYTTVNTRPMENGKVGEVIEDEGRATLFLAYYPDDSRREV